MALTGISEFTFGFAFLFEQANRNWPLKAVPILPSLQQEADQGWDAKLPTNGTDFYYQFKLSDYMWNRNAKYLKDGTYETPYFRFAFHHRNNNRQHRMLKLLADAKPDTYYVAPEINDLDIFTNAYLSRSLTNLSRLIPVIDCPIVVDDRQCYVSYQAGSPQWIFHSSRNPRDYSVLGTELQGFYERSRRRWRRLDDQFGDEVFQKVLSSASVAIERENIAEGAAIVSRLVQHREKRTRGDSLRTAADILHSIFGCTLVLVGNAEGG
jgi:hypothetical protein